MRIINGRTLDLKDKWQSFTKEDGLAGNDVHSILEDFNHNLWFGTLGGISRYDGRGFKNFTTKDGLAGNNVYSILEDSKHNLWLGTGSGVNRYDGKKFKNFTTKDGLAHNFVRSMLEDSEHNLWFATWGGGVSRYDGMKFVNFTTKDGLAGNRVISILEDSEHNLWFGTRVGVSRYAGQGFVNFTEKDGLAGDSVNSILEDSEHNLWFATWEGGVSRYDGQEFKNFTKEDGLAHNRVLSIFEDSKHTLWVGTLGGLSRYDGQEFKNFTKEDGLVNDFVLSILEDSNHNLWFGTSGKGVSRLTPAYLIAKDYLAKDPNLLYPAIYSLFEDAKYPDAALSDLIKVYKKENNELVVKILEVYEHLNKLRIPKMEWKPELVREIKAVLRDAVNLISKTDNLLWAKEIYSIYNLFYQAIQADSAHKIISLNKDIEALLAILTKDVLYPQVLDTLQAINRVVNHLIESDRIEEIGDKLGYLAEGLIEIKKAKTDLAQIKIYPEWLAFSRLFDLWRQLIENEISTLRGRARLVCELTTTRQILNKSNILTLSIKNRGQSGAENISVRIDVSPSEVGYEKEAIKRLAYIAGGKEADLEFEIIPRIEGNILLRFELAYQDAKGEHKEDYQSEILSLLEPEYEYKPIPENPYSTGLPVKSKKMFFGRDDVLKWVESNITVRYQTNVLLIYGERRCGKTSILYQLPLNINKCLFSLIDMQGLGARDTSALFYEIADNIYFTLKDVGRSVNEPKRDDFEKYPYVQFGKFIKGVEAVLKENEPLVLCFDEFEILRELEEKDTGLLPYFRALMQKSKKLAFIFTGTHELKKLCKEYWSVYFNIGFEKPISFLDDGAGKELIEKPLAGYIEYEKGATNKILKVTGGHPYFIQLICHEIVEQLKNSKKNLVSLKDVHEALKPALVHLHNAYDFDKFSQEAKLAASSLAEVTDEAKPGAILDELKDKVVNEYKIELEVNKLSEGLQELEEMDLIKERFVHQQTRYEFNLELFRLWVKEYRPLPRLKEEIRYGR